MKDNLLELNGLKKVQLKRQVHLEYRVEKVNEINLIVNLEEDVVNTGMTVYSWDFYYYINEVAEYGMWSSSAVASELYNDALTFFMFIREMECVPVDTWELVRMDINEFLGQSDKIVLKDRKSVV